MRFGRFEVLERLGAIKFLPERSASDPARLARLADAEKVEQLTEDSKTFLRSSISPEDGDYGHQVFVIEDGTAVAAKGESGPKTIVDP